MTNIPCNAALSGGVLEVLPTDHAYALRPSIDIQSTRQAPSGLSNYERKQSLTEAFGSKKKQRALRAASSNVISAERISGVGIVEAAMNDLADAATAAGTETVLNGAEKAQEMNREMLLPAYDTTTDDVTAAYPLNSLIPPSVMQSLGDVFDAIYAEYSGETSLADHFETQLKGTVPIQSVRNHLDLRPIISDICSSLLILLHRY